MSTPGNTNEPKKTPASHGLNEVTVYSHSGLFYWWPVWLMAFIMAGLTYLDGGLMAVVPSGTKARVDVKIPTEGDPEKTVLREAYVLPEKGKVERNDRKDLSSQPRDPRLHVSSSKNLGVIFFITMLLVLVITNVPLRGMWSVVVIITIILLAVILALADVWEVIFDYVGRLDIRITMGGYLFLGITLLIIWLVALRLFDRQVYIVFTPGQFKVCEEIGAGEKVYDTMGMTLERQRGDIFRHWVLGLGSGDLVVHTTGAQAHHFSLPNVLFINKKVQMIEEMLKKRNVIETN